VDAILMFVDKASAATSERTLSDLLCSASQASVALAVPIEATPVLRQRAGFMAISQSPAPPPPRSARLLPPPPPPPPQQASLTPYPTAPSPPLQPIRLESSVQDKLPAEVLALGVVSATVCICMALLLARIAYRKGWCPVLFGGSGWTDRTMAFLRQNWPQRLQRDGLSSPPSSNEGSPRDVNGGRGSGAPRPAEPGLSTFAPSNHTLPMLQPARLPPPMSSLPTAASMEEQWDGARGSTGTGKGTRALHLPGCHSLQEEHGSIEMASRILMALDEDDAEWDRNEEALQARRAQRVGRWGRQQSHAQVPDKQDANAQSRQSWEQFRVFSEAERSSESRGSRASCVRTSMFV